MRRIIALTRLVIPALVLSACVSAPPTRPPEPDAAQQARAMQATGSFAEAAELWQEASLVAVGPDRHLFRLRAAEAWLLAGEPAKSNRQLGQVETAQLGRSELSRHALLNAELALLDADAQPSSTSMLHWKAWLRASRIASNGPASACSDCKPTRPASRWPPSRRP